MLLCFIDNSKAFDYVDHAVMQKMFQEMGFPEHLIIMMHNLYPSQVRMECGETEDFGMGRASDMYASYR